MDYILTKAVQFGKTAEAPELVCLYDINCQFPVNIHKRMAAKTYLLDDDTLDKFTWGIGTWHVHGHKNQCLARFSPSFILGVGTTTGEILESLWALTNDTGRMSSIMTLAHRIEAMDTTMLESNRQKILGLGIYALSARVALANADLFDQLTHYQGSYYNPESSGMTPVLTLKPLPPHHQMPPMTRRKNG